MVSILLGQKLTTNIFKDLFCILVFAIASAIHIIAVILELRPKIISFIFFYKYIIHDFW